MLYTTPSIDDKFIFSGLTLMCSNFVQPPNILGSIEVTEFPIVTDVRPEQYSKAYSPIVVTELGIITDLRPKHL